VKGTRDIRIHYSTIDRFSETRRFTTLAGAQACAQRRLGTRFDVGQSYAVCGDGVGKIEVAGASLAELTGITDDGTEHRFAASPEHALYCLHCGASETDHRL
jgi:hypothetical protein